MQKRVAWILLTSVFLIALCGAGAKSESLIIVDADVQCLYLYRGEKLVCSYPCAVGKRTDPSPLGIWKVNGKSAHWGGGFGTRFISIDCPWGRYGIHGTNRPASIGGDTSHGCIRMLNDDIEELYSQISVGTTVIIERSCYGNMAAGLRQLRPGTRGSDVKEVQMRLKALGYLYGEADGIYGEATKAALLRFKSDYGLHSSDVVDWNTYQALKILLFE